MLVSWLIFPALLALLSLGCGLLIEAAAGRSLPAALLAPVGFCAIVVAGQATTALEATAELTEPVVVALAAAGFVAAGRHRAREGRRPRDRWAIAAAIAVLAATGAPVIASGEPTFAGYIKLDDTATWLALTDRVLEHGHEVSSLPPSSYEATLEINLGGGYPVGVFVPLGIGSELTATDPAWLNQPYMSFAAALLALALVAVLAPLRMPGLLTAAIAFVAAQPAVLFGYMLWGGVKEVAAAAVLVTIVGALALSLERASPPRAALIPALAIAALLAILSPAGAVWIVPALAAAVLWGWRRLGRRHLSSRLAIGAAAAIVLSLPLLVPAVLGEPLLPPTSAPLDDGDARGNLIEPLAVAQIAGIWPAGDFRLEPEAETLTILVVVLALLSAAIAIGAAIRRGWIGATLLGLGIPASALALVVIGSPWVGGKAIATASPAVLAIALAGAVTLARARHRAARIAARAAGAAIAAGVLWSNAAAYGGASLAPYDQLRELELIGELIAGQGPTLMTEYQPYGVRHFLRDADPEGASELRRRTIPLRNGDTLEKGAWADTDALRTEDLFTYRTLVLRRSPAQSRPPGAYQLVWRGEEYEVWQRPPDAVPPARRIPLGQSSRIGAGIDPPTDPSGVAHCELLRRLASRGGREGAVIAFVRRPATILAQPSEGSLVRTIELPASGRWTFWLERSIRAGLSLLVDGELTGEVRHDLNNAGLYAELGAAELGAGRHEVVLRYSGPGLEPGSADPLPREIGALVATVEAELVPEAIPAAAAAAQLCGVRLDWIELE